MAADARAAEVPLHRANAMLNHRFSRNWKGYAAVLYESSLEREAGDIRSAMPEQTSVDVALTWLNSEHNTSVTVSVYNALDEDLENPSRDVNGNAMSDYPASGRSVMLAVELLL